MSGSIIEAEVTRPRRITSAFFRWFTPAAIAVVAGAATLATLDGVGETDSPVAGPGLTLDEVFNIQAGDYLWNSLFAEGANLFDPAARKRVFDDPAYNPDHPPLGRLLIGLSRGLFTTHGDVHPQRPQGNPVVAARTASALAFAVTVFFAGLMAARWYGPPAGWAAAVAVVTMPRVFGHAHLASLETILGLMFAAAVLHVADAWTGRRPRDSKQRLDTDAGGGVATVPLPGWWCVIGSGVLLGLVLLTKIQAVLIPLPVGCWALWVWGPRVMPRLILWGLVGVAVFVAGWPWLWTDPVGRTLEYLGRGADRPTLYCYYLGTRYADVDVPWHYPIVMFLVTIPVGSLALGLWGSLASARAEETPASNPEATGRFTFLARPAWGRREPHSALVALVILFTLAFFALPGITVYDGERLFLVVFPLFAVLVGRGAALLLDRLPARIPLICRLLLIKLLLAAQFFSIVRIHPCELSYYNVLVGGLGGANRLGFEPTYWRDSFTREFLEDVADAVPPGSLLYCAPVLHPANKVDLELLSPILRAHNLRIDSYDDRDPAKPDMRYVIVFRRHADQWAALEPAPVNGTLLAEVSRAGVQLAACYELRQPARAAIDKRP